MLQCWSSCYPPWKCECVLQHVFLNLDLGKSLVVLGQALDSFIVDRSISIILNHESDYKFMV